MVKINGEQQDMAGKTVAEMLEHFEYNKDAVAVERNEEIVPKATFANAILEDGDIVEVVQFMGGG